jgi:hypothetical protein
MEANQEKMKVCQEKMGDQPEQVRIKMKAGLEETKTR